MGEKTKVTQLLHLEEVTTLTYFVFVGHPYLQHRRYDRRGAQCLLCHAYPLPLSNALKGTITFAYEKRFTFVKNVATSSGKS